MSTRAFSASLRSTPGYAAGGVQSAYTPVPLPALPALPTAPSGPNGAINPATAFQEQTLLNQWGTLPATFNAQRQQLGANLRESLAGYGGVKLTEQPDGSMAIETTGELGDRERAAVSGERNAANARGMLYSSFADQGIGAALTRVNEAERSIFNQYAPALKGIDDSQLQTRTDLLTSLGGLYGTDAEYFRTLAPPATPAADAAPSGPANDPAAQPAPAPAPAARRPAAPRPSGGGGTPRRGGGSRVAPRPRAADLAYFGSARDTRLPAAATRGR